MAYTIEYLVQGRVEGSQRWSESYASAKEHGEAAVASGKADRVQIRDGNGALVWHHPTKPGSASV